MEKKADLEKRQSRRNPRGLDVDSQAQAGKYTKIPDPKNTQYLLNRFFDQFLDLGLQKPFFFRFFLCIYRAAGFLCRLNLASSRERFTTAQGR